MIDWLPRQPFWIAEKNGYIAAVLALPPDPPEVAWLRVFACSAHYRPSEMFDRLFERASDQLRAAGKCPITPSLAMHPWYDQILRNQRFYHHQDIIVYSWDRQPIPKRPQPEGLTLRPLLPSDLPAVLDLDHACFENIWQFSMGSLEHAYELASYATVGEVDGRLIAYQLSTENPLSAHLARIAVHPSMQGRHIAFAVLRDLAEHYVEEGIWQVTLNTQSTNRASQALYESFGFQLTEEHYPVLMYAWD